MITLSQDQSVYVKSGRGNTPTGTHASTNHIFPPMDTHVCEMFKPQLHVWGMGTFVRNLSRDLA